MCVTGGNVTIDAVSTSQMPQISVNFSQLSKFTPSQEERRPLLPRKVLLVWPHNTWPCWPRNRDITAHVTVVNEVLQCN